MKVSRLFALVAMTASMLAVHATTAGAIVCNPNFRTVSSPNDGSVDTQLFGADAFSPTNAWAVGFSTDAPFTAHWDGLAWHKQAASAPGTPGRLFAVTMAGAHDVWAGGTFENSHGVFRTLIMHRKNSPWTTVPSPNASFGSNEINAIDAISPTDIWAAGDALTHGVDKNLTMHWDGSTWSRVPVPSLGTGDNDVAGLAAISHDDVWIVAQFTDDTSGFDRLATFHWTGSAWHRVHTPQAILTNDNEPRGMVAISHSSVWIAGFFDKPSASKSLFEHWDGTSWTVVPGANAMTFNFLEGISALGENDVYAVGNAAASGGSEKTLVEHWDGSSWSHLPSPNVPSVDNRLDDVAAAASGGSKHVIGVGRFGFSPTRTLVEDACPS